MAFKRVVATDYHRNGVGGVGFQVSIVEDDEHGEMLVIDFSYAYGTVEGDEQDYGYTAALNLEQAAKGNVFMHPEAGVPKSGGNAWRGDRLGDEYRPHIQKAADEKYEALIARIKAERKEGAQ